MRGWSSAALEGLTAHSSLTGPAICALALASGIFPFGVFVPITAIMLAAGGAVALGRWPPSTAAWAMAGLTAGSIVSYECGRRLPEAFKAAMAAKAPRSFAAANRLIGRHGAISIVVSRFTGPPASIPFIAGYLGLLRTPFLVAAAASSLWAPSVMAIGYQAARGLWKLKVEGP